jgi:hypothetical protein
MDEVPFSQRAQTKSEGNIQVTAAVPSAKENRELFGVDLYGKGIQPIWLKIENNDEKPAWLLPVGIDPEYFTPLEAAYVNHFGSPEINNEMDHHFFERGMGAYVEPGGVRSGFVFTNLDEGTKGFIVDLIGEDGEIRTYTFFINVPGLRIDHHRVDWQSLYPKDEIVSYNEESLRKALESLPCCTTNSDGTEQGDPLNLVVIGSRDAVHHAFIRAGWDETETVHATSLWKTTLSFLFGGRYRYSPVSALYVYGRPQDAALQRARGTIHERNHLRLWLSPMDFEGKPVWVGQISRDIGVRFTLKTIVTHKIDPDVDETRDFLVQDLWYSQGLAKVAYVKGVGAAPIGLRAVLWVSSDPMDLEDVEFVEWETPPDY